MKDNVQHLEYGNKIAETDEDIVDIFNEAFSQNFTTQMVNGSSKERYRFNPTIHSTLADIEISQQAVENELKRLKPNSSPGPDGISNRILKECASAFSYPLTLIYRKSLNEGELPKDWKRTNISPIYKKGKKSNPLNYRPINLCSVPCKVLEKLIKKEIITHLVSNDLILSSQHGFLPNHSCTTNLIEYLNVLTESIDSGFPMDSVMLDFRSAFDLVNFDVLLHKIGCHGIGGKVYGWIKSWITNREQRVILNGYESTWTSVLSSVVQGSVLSSTLFLIFINHIDDVISEIDSKVFVSKFADDLKICRMICEEEDSNIMQKVIDAIYLWAEENGMKLHPDKSIVVHFGYKNECNKYTLDKNKIRSEECVKDLGIMISNDLKPNKHINNITHKANFLLGQFNRSFSCKDKDTVTKMFTTFVRPILEYSTAAWSPCAIGNTDKIEKIQRRATRMISGIGKKTYEERLEICKLESLQARRLRYDLIEAYKVISNQHPIPFDRLFLRKNDIHDKNTRSQKNEEILAPKFRLQVREDFFSCRIVNDWNKLPLDVRNSESVEIFKKRYDDFVKEKFK